MPPSIIVSVKLNKEEKEVWKRQFESLVYQSEDERAELTRGSCLAVKSERDKWRKQSGS